MQIDQAFPSKYITAADLKGQPHKLTMGAVDMVDVGRGDDVEMKPLLHFVGKQKGLVLNKTNANCIASMHGQDTDFWAGKEITIIPTQTDFGGNIVPCIRVQPPGVMAPAASPPSTSLVVSTPATPEPGASVDPPAGGGTGGELDSDIPF